MWFNEMFHTGHVINVYFLALINFLRGLRVNVAFHL